MAGTGRVIVVRGPWSAVRETEPFEAAGWKTLQPAARNVFHPDGSTDSVRSSGPRTPGRGPAVRGLLRADCAAVNDAWQVLRIDPREPPAVRGICPVARTAPVLRR